MPQAAYIPHIDLLLRALRINGAIVVMQEGRVVEAGPAETVLTAPRQAYTRALIDAAPGRDWDFQNFRPMHAQAVRMAGDGRSAPAPERNT